MTNAHPLSALDELLDLAGLPRPAPGAVAIRGSDPVLPTRYRIGEAGAAAIAAAASAAAELWALRSGRHQQVAVALTAAAVSLRSARYLRIDGASPPPLWDPMSGFYPVRDARWVSLHCNFPNHRAAALAVLGTPEDRTAAMAASRGWDGLALEDAVHGAGGCAGLVRSAEEWASHPQAEAVAAQPLLEIRRIGEAPPEQLPPGDRPLAGIRALDLTRVLAGPSAARMLAEHGADVLKITGPHLPDSGAVELDTGLGKLAAHLDLRRPDDLAALRRLVAEGDVFIQSYRPGALAAHRLAPEDLAALRPGIVYVSLSAWGMSGPWAGRRGFDSIVQTVSGMAALSGEDGMPALLPVSAIDYVSGALMALGTMAALQRRAREGGSWLVRVGLARTGRWITDRGLLEPAALAGIAPDRPEAEIAALSADTPSPSGRIRHLRPVAELSLTPAFWARPPVPLGYHPPAWPPRPG